MEDMKQCSLATEMTTGELSELQPVVDKVQSFFEVLQTIFPTEFLEELNNPCWYSNFNLQKSIRRTLITHLKQHTSLHEAQIIDLSSNITEESETNNLFCLPYFFVPGFAKCGSTSLHSTLKQHPQILPPATKEPQWWTRSPLRDMNVDLLKLVSLRYPLYFAPAAKEISAHPSDKLITYDAAQSYLWDSNFLSKINNLDYCATPALFSRILPNAKFIVIMRNPITRALSDFYMMCSMNPQQRRPPEMHTDPAGRFHAVALKDMTTFNNCLMTTGHSLPWCLGELRSHPQGCGYIGRRLLIGLYYVHIHKWMQFYPRENFLFLRTEDMLQEPHQLMTRITEFLGIDPVSEDQAKEWLSKVSNARHWHPSVDPAKLVMRQETVKLLEDFFGPYNAKLAELAGDERFLWKD